ncbi:MAG: carboxypeptidase regulatory-like domain-containing protein [Leptolyngbya sp. SIOISBB]|nr:carboxypeptidase regulatory-like domain-containing protein [Leptolyngbya sp. SIOISBB]
MCTASDSGTQQSLIQGVRGKVRKLTGNQMPSSPDQPNSGNMELVQTTVWIFTAPIPGNGSPRWPVAEAEQHSNLVRQVESDRNGCYRVELPPGEYTIFAQYDDHLYLNSFQGDGSYSFIEVAPNQLVQLDLTNTENAFF